MLIAKAANGITSHQSHSPRICVKSDHHFLVDLKLDTRLHPTSIGEYTEKAPHASSSQQLANRLGDRSKTYAIGSGLVDDHVYYPGDLGLFGCIFEAWKHHWVLRTSPEDWWGPIACKIAKAIDKAAKGERKGAQQVRDLFVSHQGKEEIAVPLDCFTIYDANYDFLFSEVSSQIRDKIKVPGYAQAMQNDFTSSESVHKISSQINLMASMQEFFEYSMMCCGCGLRGLEMGGSVEDWERLAAKLKQVRLALEPIMNQIRLYDSWWDSVLDVFENLANTRRNPEDPAVAKFWINILCDTTDTKYVGGGGSMPGRPVEVEAYDGWLVSFLTDRLKIRAEDLKFGGSTGVKEQLGGWNSVPLNVELTWCNPPLQDKAELVAGIVGFKVHGGKGQHGEQDSEEKMNGDPVPSVEPNHMWAMLLPPTSKLRGNAVSVNLLAPPSPCY